MNERTENTLMLGTYTFLGEFYHQGQTIHVDTLRDIRDQVGDRLIYGDANYQKILGRRDIEFTKTDSFPHFHTTKMSTNFLDPSTRNQNYEFRYLYKIDE